MEQSEIKAPDFVQFIYDAIVNKVDTNLINISTMQGSRANTGQSSMSGPLLGHGNVLGEPNSLVYSEITWRLPKDSDLYLMEWGIERGILLADNVKDPKVLATIESLIDLQPPEGYIRLCPPNSRESSLFYSPNFGESVSYRTRSFENFAQNLRLRSGRKGEEFPIVASMPLERAIHAIVDYAVRQYEASLQSKVAAAGR